VQLRRIALLLETDPGLKPTTAIRAIGVSDPSTIRRLRDKLKADASGEPALSASPSPNRGHSAELLEARPTGRPARPDRPSGGAFSGGLAEVRHGSDSEAQLSWFTQWCAFGLFAVSSTVEAQMAVMEDFLRVPQVASALRQQLLFTEMAKAFCPARPSVRSTLH
jgi:hypothetical protein